jgi:hypothetical protein
MVISHSYVNLPEGNFNPIPIAIFVGFYMALAAESPKIQHPRAAAW